MGDHNQLAFVARHANRFDGPFLEVGSRDYGSTQDLRSLFPAGVDYVGTDLSAGKGVDVVCDLTWPFEQVDAAFEGRRFGTIFCLSMLEHCAQPFLAAENIVKLLAPQGTVCVSVPFAWQFHGYPSDYWRFTHEGVKKLFPALEFPDELSVACGATGEFAPADVDAGKRELRTKPHFARGHWWRALSAGFLRILARTGPARWALDHPYVLAPTMITMIGRQRADEARRLAS